MVKLDYSSMKYLHLLASAGGDAVAVIGYLDQGGKGIIHWYLSELFQDAFDTFILSDGMIGDSLTEYF